MRTPCICAAGLRNSAGSGLDAHWKLTQVCPRKWTYRVWCSHKRTQLTGDAGSRTIEDVILLEDRRLLARANSSATGGFASAQSETVKELQRALRKVSVSEIAKLVRVLCEWPVQSPKLPLWACWLDDRF